MTGMRPKVYVAGPFRGPDHWKIAQNVRVAEAAAHQVWSMGGAAFCPHLNTMHFQDSLPDNVWLEGDREWLAVADALYVVGEWWHSKGTQAEIEFAEEHRIPVFYGPEELLQWLAE